MIIKARNSDESEIFDCMGVDIFYSSFFIEIRKRDNPILFNIIVYMLYILGALSMIRGIAYICIILF